MAHNYHLLFLIYNNNISIMIIISRNYISHMFQLQKHRTQVRITLIYSIVKLIIICTSFYHIELKSHSILLITQGKEGRLSDNSFDDTRDLNPSAGPRIPHGPGNIPFSEYGTPSLFQTNLLFSDLLSYNEQNHSIGITFTANMQSQ